MKMKRLSFLVPFLILSCFGGGFAARADWQSNPTGAEPGTLALWKFDDPDAPGLNAAEAGGYLLSFSPAGTETGAGVAGKFGYAFRSIADEGDGGSIRKNIAFAEAKESADLFHEDRLTVDFWYLPEAIHAQGTFFDKKRTDPTGIRLFISKNGSLVLEVGNGDRSEMLAIPHFSWEAGRWVHLAACFESTGETSRIRLYRDGSLLGERELPGFGPLVSGRHPWRIGNRRIATYASQPGCYDNFRISSSPFTP